MSTAQPAKRVSFLLAATQAENSMTLPCWVLTFVKPQLLHQLACKNRRETSSARHAAGSCQWSSTSNKKAGTYNNNGDNGNGRYDFVDFQNCNRAAPDAHCLRIQPLPLHTAHMALGALTHVCMPCSENAQRLLPPQQWTVPMLQPKRQDGARLHQWRC